MSLLGADRHPEHSSEFQAQNFQVIIKLMQRVISKVRQLGNLGLNI